MSEDSLYAFQTLCVPSTEPHPSTSQLHEQNPEEALKQDPSPCEKSQKSQRLRGDAKGKGFVTLLSLSGLWLQAGKEGESARRRGNCCSHVTCGPTQGTELSSMIHSTQNTTGRGQWVKATLGALRSPKKHTAESLGTMVTV